ncbi:hypothetical protein HDU97_006722 [Phlyctochytrium planicorne]|nr:hypothetical protein HDU97_006722 [Phlyctochytrium planicorne]
MQDNLAPLVASVCLPVLRRVLQAHDGMAKLPSRRSLEHAILTCDFVANINGEPASVAYQQDEAIPSIPSPPPSPPNSSAHSHHIQFSTPSPFKSILDHPTGLRPLQFPPEILLNIFRCLQRDRGSLASCAIICKSWNPLATQILYATPIRSRAELAALLSAPTSQASAEPNNTDSSVAQRPKVVTEVEPVMVKLAYSLWTSREIVPGTLTRCDGGLGRWVRHLNLTEAFPADSVSNHRLVYIMTMLCPELRDLKICLRMDVGTLAHIFNHCPKLVGFSLSTPQVKVDAAAGGAAVPSTSELTVASTATSETLGLFSTMAASSNLVLKFKEISKSEEAALALGISRLQYLLFEMNGGGSSLAAVAKILASNLGPNLRELHFSGIETLSEVSLCSKVGPKLEILRLTECAAIDDTTLLRLPSQCPNLRILDLWGSPSVSDISIVPILRSCSKLEALDVTFTAATMSTIEYIASSPRTVVPRLHTIFMENVSCPSRVIIEMIKTRGELLRELILCGCLSSFEEVNDVLLAIAGHAKNLRQLDVVGCTGHSNFVMEQGNAMLVDVDQQAAPAAVVDAEGSAAAETQTPTPTQVPTISSNAINVVALECKLLETFAIDEAVVEPSLFATLKRKFEVEGVFVSTFWGTHF